MSKSAPDREFTVAEIDQLLNPAPPAQQAASVAPPPVAPMVTPPPRPSVKYRTASVCESNRSHHIRSLGGRDPYCIQCGMSLTEIRG